MSDASYVYFTVSGDEYTAVESSPALLSELKARGGPARSTELSS
jgi:hypothetical protein